MRTNHVPQAPRRRTRRAAWPSLVVVAVLLLAACGGDDDDSASDGDPVASGAVSEAATDDEPPAPTDAPDEGAASTTMPAPDETAASPDAGSAGGDSLGLGIGTATVAFGDEVHRFVIASEADSITSVEGRCEVLFGTLAVDLPLVESNGTALPEGSGSLQVDIDLSGDVPDFEPYVELVVPGGHWVAGASETASLTGVETPDITLTGNGTSVTGTQSMVPLVVGPGEPIEATVDLTCE